MTEKKQAILDSTKMKQRCKSMITIKKTKISISNLINGHASPTLRKVKVLKKAPRIKDIMRSHICGNENKTSLKNDQY